MDKIAFLTVAVYDPRYIEQQARLIESIQKFHPEAEIFVWTNQFPDGSKSHDDSMYGFKVHAVNHARSLGFTKIIWIDTACILVDQLDYLFNFTSEYGIVAVEDENKLRQYCHPDAWNWFKQPVNDDWHLVGGSLFVFDFDNQLCERIFRKWSKAERYGQFGTKETRLGHRHDESCLALALYTCGSKPVLCALCRYNELTNPSIIKRHFK